jgi:hypothetical protein
MGVMENLNTRLAQYPKHHQLSFFESEQTTYSKAQRTKIENQIKVHRHRMQERRKAIAHMEAGAFPAPELLNMVFVIPV